MPFNKKILELVVATTAAMVIGSNVHMDLNENSNSQNKELKINNQKLLVQSNNSSNIINSSDTIIMAGNGKAYTDLENIKFNLNGKPVNGRTITVENTNGDFIGGGILSNGVVPIAQLEEGQTILGKQDIVIKVQGCTKEILIKNKNINMLNYEMTKISGLKPGETYKVEASPASQTKTVTANSNGDIFIKRDNAYAYINLYKNGQLIKSLPGEGTISGANERYTIPDLKKPETEILPYFVIGEGDIIIDLGTVNRKFVDSDGKVIKENTFTGEVGTSIGKAEIPTGYEVKNITVEKNGQVISGELPPTSIGDSKITVIYHLQKKKQYGNVVIKVVDGKTGKILNGATVNIDGQMLDTNSNGEVEIKDVVQGDINVTASDKGYTNGQTSVKVNPNETVRGIISLMPEAGKVIVTVNGENGPLKNTKVTVNGVPEITNGEGQITVKTSEGPNTITIGSKNYHNGTVIVDGKPGETEKANVTLTPDNGTMKITVVDGLTKKPLENANVTYNGKTYRTDSKGEVTISNVVPGDITVDGSDVNYHNGSTKVEVTPNGEGTGTISLTPDNGTMKITVVDSLTKKALENANVTYNGKTYRTDSKGEVTITNVVPGDITVDGSDVNYHNGSTKIEVTPNGEGTGTISLTPDNGTMKITVVDSLTKKALENANVTYNGKTYRTDSKGEVTISNVVPGDITVDGSDVNYHSASTKVEVTPNGQGTGTISLIPDNGTMKITVVDSLTKKVLENANVTYNGKTYKTGSKGEVTISNVVPGDITVDGSDVNYHNGSTKIEVTSNEQGTGIISLTPDNGTVVIKIVDSKTGKILSGATVNINGQTLRTNSNGEVQVNNVKPGEINATASDKGYTNGQISIKADSNKTVTGIISLNPEAGKVIVTVNGENGPLKNTKVTVNGVPEITNGEGQITVKTSEGPNTITIGSKNYHNGTITVDGKPGETEKANVTLIPDNGTMKITVVDSLTKKALENANVNYNGKTYTTDSKGEVTISNVVPGDITVDGSDVNYHNGSTKVEVTPNGQGTGTISLTPDNGTMKITVVDSLTKKALENANVNYNGKTYRTDSKGEVTISNVVPGDIIVDGSDVNYHSGSTKVEVTPNGEGTGTISLTPDNGTMKITVVDSLTKKVLENANVTYNGKTYRTDSKGEVTISNVVPGDITVDGSDVNYHSASTKVEVTPNGQGTGTISLIPDNGTMKITVVDSLTKKPLENANVTYNGKTYRTDSKGEVIISNVVPGDITVDGSDVNYHSASTKVEVTPNGQGTGIISLTPDNGTVVIKVVDSKTGKILSGATVDIDGQILRTNSNGEVQVNNVKPGEINATASDKGYTNGQISIKADSNKTVTGIISLNPEAGKAIVTVNGENGPLKNTKVIVNGVQETTNGKGEVTVKTTEGPNTITIGSKNYHNGAITVDGKPGETEKANVTLIPDNGTMKIIVVDSLTKKVLENAKVTYDGKTYTTGSNGEVIITNVVPGDITVDGSCTNYHSGNTKVQVTSNGEGTGIISLTPDNGTMKITVVDGLTKKALENANVTYNGKTYTTDSKGEVTISNVVPGDITVNGSDVNYHNGSTKIEVTPNGQGTGTISLTPDNGTMKITVVDSLTKKALENANVTYNGKTYRTDSKGEVTISNVVPGDITVNGSDVNYHNGSTKIEVTPNGQGTGTISLTPDNGTMKITVVDSLTKKALENANVNYNGKTYRTDSKGEVTITNVVPGDITVNGSDVNYHNGSTKVEVTPNGEGTGTISLTPDNGTMKVTVVDSLTKKPLENANVNYNGKTYRTDSKGEVTISNVVPGDITVDGSDVNYHNGSTKIEVTPNGQGTGTISLTPDNGTMKITVVDSLTKKPLENANVNYNGKTYRTDSKGEVTISNVVPGDITVDGSDVNYHNGSTKIEVTPNGQGTGTISLTPDNGTMKITVVDSLTKKALANTKIIYNGKTYTTDSKGQVIIPNVVPGNITVDGSDNNYHNGSTKIVVDSNGQGTGIISLTPDNGTVVIKVVDSKTGKILSGATVNIDGQILSTNSNGEVQVKNVKPGEISAKASDEGYTDGQILIKADSNKTVTGIISLNPEAGKVIVTVNGENGPLKNTTVTVNGVQQITNGEGQVTVKTTEGPNTITIGSKNYHNGIVTVDGKPGKTEKANVTLIPDNGTMKIKVIDSLTKKALENANVNYNGKIYRTDSNGEVIISNVVPGDITVDGSDVNYHNGSTKIEVTPNGEGTGTISLTPDNGTVVIKVVDNKTGKILSGAIVNINGQRLRTNSNGEVQVSDVKPGEINATASNKGYTNGQTSVKLSPNGKATGIISLNPEAGKVIVTVNGENGPLKNATVTVNGVQETTNGEGQITVKTTEGSNTITIGSKNYHNGAITVDGKVGETEKANVTLTPDNGIMKITVVDSLTKKALENANVTYNGKTYRTDSKGEVTISNVVPGDITVDGSDVNYHSGSTKVEVTPNGQGTGTISLIPDNGTMKITVVDSLTKKALENAKVTYNGKTYTTDSNGEVTISNVVPGDITVDGSDVNYHNGSTKVEVTPNGQGTGTISLTPDNGTVVIKVVDSKTGKVLSGATVNINGQTLSTNSDGEVQVNDVKPGEINATASDKGYTTGQTSVKLDPNGKVTGTISLAPLSGKVIITVNSDKGLLRNKNIIVNGKTEKTNSNGEITVGTTAGINHIKISSSGYNDKNIDINVTSGGTKYRTVTLTPKVASVRINTVGKDGDIISSKIVNENDPQLDIPKGYKVSSITVNGEKINKNNLTKSDLENKNVSINIINDNNLPNTGIDGQMISNVEELVILASIIGILGVGEVFRRKK